ncbi:hypothetical protein SteCoe_37877 [Stentor coeruleus]|uniref:Uncharacterized protein n=1 Tax=Stentor coeruleus TaxID=5963 RepID=A0A1R2AM95_9CILI|nr:hypothetical protein SteCoe_37877 [Stentor coeruleus]
MLLILLIISVTGISLTKTQEELDCMALEIETLGGSYPDSEGIVRLTAEMLEYENSLMANLLNAMEDDSLVTINSVVYDQSKLASHIEKGEGFIAKLSANNEMLVVKDGVTTFEKLV